MIASNKGFSLVELAISVTVIGILIGVVIKGGELVENARISSTVLQVKAFESGVQAFKAHYKAWPGDYSQANNFIDGCTGDTLCGNGDGNGITRIGTSSNPAAFVSASTSTGEPVKVWRHLLLAGFGAGVPSGTGVEYGEALPAANADGGFEMFFDSAIAEGGPIVDSGHFFRMSGVVVDGTDVLSTGDGVDGRIVYIMDRKMDNGNVSSGNVVAIGVGDDASSGNTCLGDSVANCVAFFGINQ